MRLLIYGAGVIGCLYAALFSEAGYDTTIYARGKRLAMLKENGLRQEKHGKIKRTCIKVIDTLAADDRFDFVFLTVRETQVHQVLGELRANCSPNIVTMVNTLEPYSQWEALCGRGRIIPAFPGAGGSFEGDVLKAGLTPRIIQPTTFGEIDGCRTERLDTLERIFKNAGVPCQIVKDMHTWQLCHLAMVVPIADAYYMAENPAKVWQERPVMRQTAAQLKRNFQMLCGRGVILSPKKMNLFRLVPLWLLTAGLILVFKSEFGEMFMYRHSMNAPDEMRRLHDLFYQYINQ